MFNLAKVCKLFLMLSLFSITTTVNSSGLDSLLKSADSMTGGSSENKGNDLLTSLTSQLGVTDTQAAGGSAALLAMANQNLSGSDSALLDSIVPTGESDSLTSQMLSQVTDMDSVQKAFSALGLDAGMVEQFAPVLLEYVTENGGASLTDSLTKLWL